MPYPYGKFRYKIEIDGLEAGGFSEVTGFDTSIEKYGNITLKQGLATSKVLYDWIVAGVSAAVDRKTITITLLDDEEAPAALWQIINAWPTKYTAPDFNAASSEVAIDTLEIAHEGMTRLS